MDSWLTELRHWAVLNAAHGQAACLTETQANVYERFLSGMMAKDKKDNKHEEKLEDPDEDEEDSRGQCVLFSLHVLLVVEILSCLYWSFLAHSANLPRGYTVFGCYSFK